MARKIPVLGRVLGAPALYASVYGEIGSSLYYALGITAVYALGLTPIVFLIAGALFTLAAAAYAEGGATIDEPGGGAAFARRAFNDMVGFIAGWATILDYLIGIALAALFIPHYVAGAFGREGSVSAHQATALAVAIVLAITVVRLFRRRDVYTVGVAVSLLDLVVQAGMAVFGLALLFDWHALTADVDLGVKPTWSALAFAIPIAMIGFTGLEKVASLAGMAKNPAKDIPDSVRTSVFTVVLIYAAIATAATSAYPIKPDPGAPAHYSSELTTTWLDAPMLGLSHAIGTHLPDPLAIAVRLAVGLTATLILVLAITTSFSGCARLCDAMGERSQLPPILGRRGRRAVLPPVALVATGVLATGFLVVGAVFGSSEEVLTLASLYSFGILISLMLANASIAWLRWTEPDMPRAFTMRGNVAVSGRQIPVPAVLGAIGAFAVWVLCLGTHEGARIVGLCWILAGPPDVRRRADCCRPTADEPGRGRRGAGGRADRHPAPGDRGAAREARRDVRGGGRDRMPLGVRERRACGRGERHRGAGARAAGRSQARPRRRGRARPGDGPLAGRRLRRRVHRGRQADADGGADGGRRRHRRGRRADRDRRARQAPARPLARGGILREDRRLRSAEGAVPCPGHALPGGSRRGGRGP